MAAFVTCGFFGGWTERNSRTKTLKYCINKRSQVVDWIGTDDRKTFIAGSNVGIPPENEPELKKRYKIEDLSEADREEGALFD
jgi:hypothetical protein